MKRYISIFSSIFNDFQEQLEAAPNLLNIDKTDKTYGITPYDVVLFVKQFVPEDKRMQLMFLLKQFVPVRANLNIIYLENTSQMDGYTYLDMNPQMYDEKTASLDDKKGLDGHIIIE